jgi:hypothetical protein
LLQVPLLNRVTIGCLFRELAAPGLPDIRVSAKFTETACARTDRGRLLSGTQCLEYPYKLCRSRLNAVSYSPTTKAGRGETNDSQ